MNPILDSKYLIPDAEAHLMPDGRLYIYGSHDSWTGNDYCSDNYRVFSCDDPALENWTDHGESFQNRDGEGQVYWQSGALYAPDAIHKDGKYYLYFCGVLSMEGVAVSDRPEGPFIDPKPIEIANGDAIDPAIFVDEDGSAYYLWGQYKLRGAKLKEDMCTIDESTLERELLTEMEHGFHEGASLRKRNGKYYIVYCDTSRGKATCLSYAMSDHPLGPYKKGGVIIDNIFCDPATWNNHGSIECFKGRWFVFYHRAVDNKNYRRRVCVEPIYFNEDGTINEVEMTTNGASAPIDARKILAASRACHLRSTVHIQCDVIDGEVFEKVVGYENQWEFRTWAEYKYLDFAEGVHKCHVRMKGACTVTLRTDRSDACGSCIIDSDEFKDYTFDVNGLSGVKPIWFEFAKGEFEFLEFWFE